MNAQTNCREALERLEIPHDKPWNDKTKMFHHARVEPVRRLKRRGEERSSTNLCALLLQTKRRMEETKKKNTHQYPEEEGDLERVLEEDEVDQVEDDPRLAEPEMAVRWLHDHVAVDRRVLLSHVVA